MAATYRIEFASATTPEPLQTDTLKSGSGWYVVKYTRTASKDTSERLHGPMSEDAADKKAKQLSGRLRSTTLRAKGRETSAVLTCQAAIAKLDALRKTHGTIKSAIEHALRESPAPPDERY